MFMSLEDRTTEPKSWKRKYSDDDDDNDNMALTSNEDDDDCICEVSR